MTCVPTEPNYVEKVLSIIIMELSAKSESRRLQGNDNARFDTSLLAIKLWQNYAHKPSSRQTMTRLCIWSCTSGSVCTYTQNRQWFAIAMRMEPWAELKLALPLMLFPNAELVSTNDYESYQTNQQALLVDTRSPPTPLWTTPHKTQASLWCLGTHSNQFLSQSKTHSTLGPLASTQLGTSDAGPLGSMWFQAMLCLSLLALGKCCHVVVHLADGWPGWAGPLHALGVAGAWGKAEDRNRWFGAV